MMTRFFTIIFLILFVALLVRQNLLPVYAQTGKIYTQSHAPAANTQATTSAVAVAGAQKVADCIVANFVAGGTAPTAANVTLVLRDGATGAGTVIFQWPMSVTAVAGDSGAPFYQCGLGIAGTPGNAMTVEFTGAGGANTLESVFLRAYDR